MDQRGRTDFDFSFSANLSVIALYDDCQWLVGSAFLATAAPADVKVIEAKAVFVFFIGMPLSCAYCWSRPNFVELKRLGLWANS